MKHFLKNKAERPIEEIVLEDNYYRLYLYDDGDERRKALTEEIVALQEVQTKTKEAKWQRWLKGAGLAVTALLGGASVAAQFRAMNVEDDPDKGYVPHKSIFSEASKEVSNIITQLRK